MTAHITPTNDLLILRKLADPPPTTAWGFELPATDDHADTPLRGLVLFAGEGRQPKLSGAGRAVVEALRGLSFAANTTGGTAGRGDSLCNALDAAIAALRDHDALPERVPMSVRVGDTVIFSPHGHQVFRIGGEDVIVTQEASVLGVLGVLDPD